MWCCRGSTLENIDEEHGEEQSSGLSGENVSSAHMTAFMDHEERNIFISSRSIHRMRIERVEMPQKELIFGTKSESNTQFADLDISKNINQTSIRKALNQGKTIPINRRQDLEFFSSLQSVETYTSLTTWGLWPYSGGCHGFNVLVDVQRGKGYYLSDDSCKIVLDKADNRKLEVLNNALSALKSSNKSTYALWARMFDTGVGRDIEIEFEAILSYWLSW